MKLSLKHRIQYWLQQRFTDLVKRHATEWFTANSSVEVFIREKDTMIRELEVRYEQQQAYCARLEESVSNAKALVEVQAFGGATYHSIVADHKVQLNIPYSGKWPGDDVLVAALVEVLDRVPAKYK